MNGVNQRTYIYRMMSLLKARMMLSPAADEVDQFDSQFLST